MLVNFQEDFFFLKSQTDQEMWKTEELKKERLRETEIDRFAHLYSIKVAICPDNYVQSHPFSFIIIIFLLLGACK